jgi:hypothetical protein
MLSKWLQLPKISWFSPKTPKCPELPIELWEKIISFVIEDYCPWYKGKYGKCGSVCGGFKIDYTIDRIVYSHSIINFTPQLFTLLHISKMINTIIKECNIWQHGYSFMSLAYRIKSSDGDASDFPYTTVIRNCHFDKSHRIETKTFIPGMSTW